MSLSSSWQRNRGGHGRNRTVGESSRSPDTQLKAFAKVNSGDICIRLHVIVSMQSCVCGALNWFGSHPRIFLRHPLLLLLLWRAGCWQDLFWLASGSCHRKVLSTLWSGWLFLFLFLKLQAFMPQNGVRHSWCKWQLKMEFNIFNPSWRIGVFFLEEHKVCHVWLNLESFITPQKCLSTGELRAIVKTWERAVLRCGIACGLPWWN